MSDGRPSLNRPIESYRDFIDFVNLAGDYESFDLTRSIGCDPSGDENVWYGRIPPLSCEILYRTSEGRWVLVFMIPPGHEGVEGPHPVDRELSSVQAARWLRINEVATPTGLRPAPSTDEGSRMGDGRLDRDWGPTRGRDQVQAEDSPESGSSVPTQSRADQEAGASPQVDTLVLGGPNDNPIVMGRSKPRLSRATYDTVKALWGSHENLSKDELDRRSGRTDARKLLKSLGKKDPDWAEILIFPGRPGLGYGIKR